MTRSATGKARRPIAVALKHQIGSGQLPRVVASGKGHVAEQILELAFANGVRVREDADLVEVLSAIDVDTEIPLEAIVAVAEILAHVYRANGTLTPDLGPLHAPADFKAFYDPPAYDPPAGPSPAAHSHVWMAGDATGMAATAGIADKPESADQIARDDLSDGPVIPIASTDSTDASSTDIQPGQPSDPSPGNRQNEKGQP